MKIEGPAIVDRAERIAEFLPVLDAMVREGLVVLSDATVVKYVAAEGE